jgi:hypothetical protein
VGVQCCNTFSPIFSRPYQVRHALSISGVHVHYYNDSLTEGKKIDTEPNLAMELALALGTTSNHCHRI